MATSSVDTPSIATRAIALAVLLVACSASAAFAGGAIGYCGLALLLIVLVFCALYPNVMARHMQLDIHAPQRECLRGDSISFDIAVKSKLPMPFMRADVVISVKGPYRCSNTSFAQTCLLSGSQRVPLRLRAVFEHVGNYGIGVQEIRIFDPFGLFWHTTSVESYTQVSVLARTSDLDELIINAEALVESQRMATPIASDGMDYAGVRAYVPGDPMKSVHWKLSARVGENLTRLYETLANPGVSIFVDLHAPELEDEELARAGDMVFEVAFSLAAIAQSAGFEYEVLFCNELGELECVTAADFDNSASALDLLYPLTIDKNASKEFAETMVEQASNPQRQSTFAIVSASSDPALMRAALDVRSYSHVPLVFACIPTLNDYAEERDRTRNLSILEESGVFYRRFSTVTQVEGA